MRLFTAQSEYADRIAAAVSISKVSFFMQKQALNEIDRDITIVVFVSLRKLMSELQVDIFVMPVFVSNRSFSTFCVREVAIYIH